MECFNQIKNNTNIVFFYKNLHKKTYQSFVRSCSAVMVNDKENQQFPEEDDKKEEQQEERHDSQHFQRTTAYHNLDDDELESEADLDDLGFEIRDPGIDPLCLNIVVPSSTELESRELRKNNKSFSTTSTTSSASQQRQPSSILLVNKSSSISLSSKNQQQHFKENHQVYKSRQGFFTGDLVPLRKTNKRSFVLAWLNYAACVLGLFSTPFYIAFYTPLEKEKKFADKFIIFDIIVESIAFISSVILPLRMSRVDIPRGIEIVEKRKVLSMLCKDFYYWLNFLGFLLSEIVWLRTKKTRWFGFCRLLRFPFSLRWISLYDKLAGAPKSLERIAFMEFVAVSLGLYYSLHLFACIWFYTLEKTHGYSEYDWPGNRLAVNEIEIITTTSTLAPGGISSDGSSSISISRYYIFALRDAIALFAASPRTIQGEDFKSVYNIDLFHNFCTLICNSFVSTLNTCVA